MAICQDIALHIGYDNLPEIVSETEHGKFSAFASDLGLKPGQWPRMITTTLGNKMAFVCQRSEVVNGDLQYVWYYQANGCIELTIFND